MTQLFSESQLFSFGFSKYNSKWKQLCHVILESHYFKIQFQMKQHFVKRKVTIWLSIMMIHIVSIYVIKSRSIISTSMLFVYDIFMIHLFYKSFVLKIIFLFTSKTHVIIFSRRIITIISKRISMDSWLL